ncbi:hypothetical protein TRICI_002261 [Trichomonascus ciferrii]|uniref:DNA replication regulator Sld3 C-terminal domain-containing protein n=1 Tax=Trichomonascus ciferrii TaxID=44093 RepID=A0A642V6C5_9ASCO|nr:hypothetical protein TRICI_002261 [Trichomonascus ciferrii]
MEEITIQATSGDEEGARVVPFKAVSPGGLPFSYFGKKTVRRPFTCGKDLMEPDGDLRVVRMFEGSKSTGHLAVVQHLSSHTWTLTKLDKAVRLKDVKRLAERTQLSQRVQVSSRESLLHECTVSPTWATAESLGRLKLDPPGSKGDEDNVPNTIPVPQLPESLPTDPSRFLEHAYFETLYLSKTPLVYFVKSTLSRTRSLCKDGSGGDKQAYLHRVIDILHQRLLSVVQLDHKYDGDRLESVVRGNAEKSASEWSDSERYFLESWKTRLENTSDASLRTEIADLKIRETQLQVVLLLEILSMRVRAGIVDQKQEHEPSSKPENKNKKPSLVRRRRKKPTAEAQQQSQQPAENDVKVNPEVLLDILFDRLCIWQALADAPTTAKSSAESGPDRLQMFCQEVIMPYFSFRLPEKSRVMVKKAQGRSTAKRPKKKQSTTTNREEPENVEPTALTQEDSFTSSAPLTQSQEPAAGDGDEFSNAARRQSSSQITRGALATSTKTQYLQERRQVSVNLKNQPKSEELMSAIHNIARPNRSRVSQEFMDSKPMFANNNKPRKRKPRPTNKPSIQVAAAEGVLSTPAHRKRLINPSSDQENEETVVATPSKKIRETDEDVHSSSVIRGTPIKGTPPLKTPSKFSPDHIMETPTSKSKASPIEHSPIKDSPFKRIPNFQDKLANRSR